MPDDDFTPQELYDCAMRELRMRQKVYAYQVRQKKISQDWADVEIARMAAIAELLRARIPTLFNR